MILDFIRKVYCIVKIENTNIDILKYKLLKSQQILVHSNHLRK